MRTLSLIAGLGLALFVLRLVWPRRRRPSSRAPLTTVEAGRTER